MRRLRWSATLIAVGALCGGALRAAEEEASFSSSMRVSATNHTLFSNAKDLNDVTAPATNTLLNEGILLGESGHFHFKLHETNKLALDTLSDQGLGGPDQRVFVLEKKKVSYETEGLEVQLGDSYQELGKGIALSLYRDEAFGIDTTLEGASVRVRKGAWEGLGFAGRINAYQMPVAINPMPNPLVGRQVWLGGGSTKLRVLDGVTAEAHSFYAGNQPTGSPYFDQSWTTIGGSLSAIDILPGVEAYAEVNALTSRLYSPYPQDLPLGWGNYGLLTYVPSAWRFKLEARDYRNYSFEFRRPPHLEEDVITTVNTTDATSTRMQTEYRFGEHLTQNVMASALAGYDRFQQDAFYHGILGTTVSPVKDLSVQLKGGYRTMPGQLHLRHVQTKVKLKTGHGQFAEVGYKKLYYETNLNFLPTIDDRNYFDFTYTFSSQFSLTLGYEYMPSNTTDLGTNFYNAGARVVLGQLQARMFVGQTAGGPQCSGGICRVVPAFAGGYADATYVF